MNPRNGLGLESGLRIDCALNAFRYTLLGLSITGRPFRLLKYLRANTKNAL